VCEPSYGGPIRLWPRLGHEDAWTTRFGGKWSSGAWAWHTPLLHQFCYLALLPLLSGRAWRGRVRTKLWGSNTALATAGA
jgi:hypothetical protein